MIEVTGLTKRFGNVTAVDDATFTVRPGIVTGFLGPNGAGKSTTLRIILGLDRPSAGRALIEGRPYRDARAPLTMAGAMLEGKSVDQGRSARNHLTALAATIGLGRERVDEVLETVGLTDVADKKASEFSLGMSQRLGIAGALMGDPRVVLLDEPANGLDPEGIMWIRALLRDLAAQGRTVLVSSHLMREMEVTADHLIVIGRGRILADTSMSGFITATGRHKVVVVSPDVAVLRDALAGPGVTFTSPRRSVLEIQGVDSTRVGETAARTGAVLHQLTDVVPSLEEAFLEMTADSVAFRSSASHEEAAA